MAILEHEVAVWDEMDPFNLSIEFSRQDRIRDAALEAGTLDINFECVDMEIMQLRVSGNTDTILDLAENHPDSLFKVKVDSTDDYAYIQLHMPDNVLEVDYGG